jgi:DNA-binding PadR family transcriptional regulator
MNIIAKLNRLFDSRYRLGIMSILMVNDWVDFLELKEILELSDGNLASHLKALEMAQYIDIKKQFVGKKPKTSYRVSTLGKKAFSEHFENLKLLIENQENRK